MLARITISSLGAAVMAACAPETASPADEPRRIISLDFCADQYLLAFGAREQIIALSPDADKSFSYLLEEARGLRQAPSRAEDILTLKPDAVIRTYGGGPNVSAFMKRAGVDIIQIDYANDLAAIRENVVKTAAALGNPARGLAVAAEMDRRLAAIETAPQTVRKAKVLYMTSKGAAAGRQTMIDELIIRAGQENFVESAGWRVTPLERLAYEDPDIIAAGFFDGPDARTDFWSPARHPVARRALRDRDVVDIPGSWTACGAWFVVDAVEAMAAAR